MTEDLDTMLRAAAGDPAAVGKLYDQYAHVIYSVLLSKLTDPTEAQDIVHDVFVKVQTRAHQYDPKYGKPIAWMLGIARNEATDRLRRRTLQAKYITREQIGPEKPFMETADQSLHDDELHILSQCLGLLSPPQRQTLQLAYFSGCTHQEIADQLTQPLGSVKAWIRRGLLKLKDCVIEKL